MPRFLRPNRVLCGAEAIWLVDEAWPVAAKLAADGSTSLVTWQWPDDVTDPDACRVVLTDGVGLVAKVGRHVLWVGPDGTTVVRVDEDLELAAADSDTVWLVDDTSIDPGSPPSPPPPLPPGRIVAVHRDGTSQQVVTPAPVTAVGVRDLDLWVTLAEPPVTRSSGRGSWAHHYPSSVLGVSRDRLLTSGLDSAVPATGDVPAGRSSHRWSPWLDQHPEWTLAHGVAAGALMWTAGARPGEDKINRRALAIGYEPGRDRPAVQVDLGLGLVRDAQAVDAELWVVVARRRYLAVPLDRGVDVLAVSSSGAVRTVHHADSIDVSHTAPPLRPLSDEQIHRHINEVQHKFDHLENFWRNADGETSPLSEGLTGGEVSVEGHWPNVKLVITLRHPRRPGLLLRRTLSLFDEQGSPVDHQYADIYLMEDLDTNYLAPADEAVDGVLDT